MMRKPPVASSIFALPGALLALCAVAVVSAWSADPAAPAAGTISPATEAIQGFVRANPDRYCNAGCGDYYIEDGRGFFLSHLAGSSGSVGIYTDRYIETTGYRAPCGGCTSFYITGPVNIIVTGVEGDPVAVPWSVTLRQNYPNPFNPVTTIPFAITRESAVSLTVYDLLGRVVDRPADGRYAPGAHAVAWDAHDRPAGVYVYEIRATPADGAPVIERKTMMLLR